MAELIFFNRDTGDKILLNRDHIMYAEDSADGGTIVTLTNGDHLVLKEPLSAVRSKS